jgi:hypothetical protein
LLSALVHYTLLLFELELLASLFILPLILLFLLANCPLILKLFFVSFLLFFFAFAATTIIGHFNIRVLLTLLPLSRWVLFVLNGQLLDLILRLLTVDLLYVLDPLLSLFLELYQAQRSSCLLLLLLLLYLIHMLLIICIILFLLLLILLPLLLLFVVAALSKLLGCEEVSGGLLVGLGHQREDLVEEVQGVLLDRMETMHRVISSCCLHYYIIKSIN